MESAQDNQGRILLVDDESAILRTFRYCLEDEGYSVATANSATQAETLLQRQVFDLCFWICAWVRTTAWTCWHRCASRRRGCAW